MAADWRGVQEGISQGFQRGLATGGKLSGLGIIIGKVADRLKSQREMGEQQTMALDLLGKTEKIKAMYSPQKWEPRTKEEAISYEQEKNKIKAQPEAIVDKAGNIIGYRPSGSVFQPSASIDEIIGQLGTGGGLPTINANTPKVNVPTDTGNRVTVISPDGKRGSIPKEQLQEALSNGYKRTLK